MPACDCGSDRPGAAHRPRERRRARIAKRRRKFNGGGCGRPVVGRCAGFGNVAHRLRGVLAGDREEAVAAVDFLLHGGRKCESEEARSDPSDETGYSRARGRTTRRREEYVGSDTGHVVVTGKHSECTSDGPSTPRRVNRRTRWWPGPQLAADGSARRRRWSRLAVLQVASSSRPRTLRRTMSGHSRDESVWHFDRFVLPASAQLAPADGTTIRAAARCNDETSRHAVTGHRLRSHSQAMTRKSPEPQARFGIMGAREGSRGSNQDSVAVSFMPQCNIRSLAARSRRPNGAVLQRKGETR